MPFVTRSSIQELTDRMDAIAVVSDYVRMEKRGNRFWACCPFHKEKTGSFTVDPDLKTYYCFGCHKGGTVINFVMEMDKLTFPETLELLAKRFGVELAYENSGGTAFSAEDDTNRKKKEELFDLYQRLKGTFHHFLLKKPEAGDAKRYIISRGICEEMIERFSLGYSPLNRHWLYDFLSKKGYSDEFLATSGLFSQRDKRSSIFSGRLMFSIADKQGKTIAFGGRCMPNPAEGREQPKYINSPESPIYKKGHTLYAADLALPEIRRTKMVYIAEGYMDVIALHQAGITNAVAPLGTAFTDEQARLLKRWAERVILFFDSDEAGKAAAVKGIYTCRRNGLNCSLVVSEGEGESEQLKDPADILLVSGPEALARQANTFIDDFDYLLKKAASLRGGSSAPGRASGKAAGSAAEKAQAVAFLFPYLDLVESEVARTSCIEAAADAFGLLPALVAEDYLRHKQGESSSGKRAEKEPPAAPKKGGTPVSQNEELSLLFALAIDYVSSKEEQLFVGFRSAFEIGELEDPNAKELFLALEECFRYEENSIDELLARIDNSEIKKLIVERNATGEFSGNTGRFVADGIKKLKRKSLERKQDEIIINLRAMKNRSATEAGEEQNSDVKELLAEKMRIDEEINILKQGRYA